MKIAVLGEHQPEAAEGMAIATRRLTEALHDVADVLELPLGDVRRDERTAVLRDIKRVRDARVDVLYYAPKSGLTRAALLRAATLRSATGRPLVLSCLQMDRTIWRPRLMPLPDELVVPSERMQQALLIGGLMSTSIPLGVDTEHFTSTGLTAAGLWSGNGGKRLLHVGHLTVRRNLAVFADLAQRGFDCLVVASPSTEPEAEVVETLESAGVAVVRRFIPDLGAVYRAADAYVFPVEDPRGCIEFPLSVLEAISCGIPVVSTPFGAVPELARDSGRITITSTGSFVEALNAHAQERDSTSFRARTWKDVAEDHSRLFDRVAAAKPRARLIVLVGVDGTGKTTQAEQLVADATDRGIDAVAIWSRWKPLFLGPLMRLARRATSGSPGEHDPVRETEALSLKRRIFRNPAARLTWECLASLDYALQTVPRLRYALRGGRMVVSDRYSYDALVDLAVNFGTSVAPRRGLFRFFPQPDAVIVLDAPAELALRRKSDTPSIGYLDRRRPLYLELARRNGWPVIDTQASAETVRGKIASIVWGPTE